MKLLLIVFGIYLFVKNGSCSQKGKVVTNRDPEDDILPQISDD